MKKSLSSIFALFLLFSPIVVVAVGTIGELAWNVAGAVNIAVAAFVVIAWVVVAVMFLTAWGSPERLSKAKSALIWAIAGTALFVLGNSIVAIISNAIGA